MDQLLNSDAPLEVTVQWGEDGDVVLLAGEFDIYGAARVTATINGLLARGRRHIVIDLDAVSFIDGAAIGALISANERARRVDGSLQVTAHAACSRLLRLTGELDRLSFHESGPADDTGCSVGASLSSGTASARRAAPAHEPGGAT